MPATSLGRRLDLALLALQLSPQGSAVDYGRDVVSSSPDKKSAPPSADLTAEDWAAQAERLVVGIESALSGEPVQPQMSLGALKLALRPLAGQASGFAAYVLGQSVDRVKAARAVMNVDDETGLAKPRALTSREAVA